MRIGWAMAAVWLAVGCGGVATQKPEVEVGTGADAFSPLVDGQQIPIHVGYQGGYHFLVNLRARGLDADAAKVTFTGNTDDGAEVCRVSYPHLPLADQGDGVRTLRAGVYCYIADPTGLTGERVTLHAQVEEGTGPPCGGERAITAGSLLRPY